MIKKLLELDTNAGKWANRNPLKFTAIVYLIVGIALIGIII